MYQCPGAKSSKHPVNFFTFSNDWMEDAKGKQLHRHLPKPNSKGPINNFERKDQCNIFWLRTGHVMLNGHLFHQCVDIVVPHTRQ